MSGFFHLPSMEDERRITDNFLDQVIARYVGLFSSSERASDEQCSAVYYVIARYVGLFSSSKALQLRLLALIWLTGDCPLCRAFFIFHADR